MNGDHVDIVNEMWVYCIKPLDSIYDLKNTNSTNLFSPDNQLRQTFQYGNKYKVTDIVSTIDRNDNPIQFYYIEKIVFNDSMLDTSFRIWDYFCTLKEFRKIKLKKLQLLEK